MEVCQGADNISDLHAVELRSGSWTGELPFDCSRSSKCVVSPYDPRFKATLEAVRNEKPMRIEEDSLKRKPLSEQKREIDSSCHHRISARVCFGDCMSNDPSCKGERESGYAITLTSASYEGEETVEVCGDRLLEKFKTENTPKALRAMVCRAYYFEESQKVGGIQFSCGAVRFATPECDRY